MDTHTISLDTRRRELLRKAASISIQAASRAASLDRSGAFPVDDVHALGTSGLLAAPLPVELGGCADDDAAHYGPWMLEILHRLGRGNMALGRVFEAHVNALRLVVRYGSASQKRRVAADALSGRLFALWVTDPASAPLEMTAHGDRVRLRGGKAFCSAAGYAACAVVTAVSRDGGSQLLLIDLDAGERVAESAISLQGMRAATTGEVDFDGCEIGCDAVIGDADDYLREPEFSTGAWRSSAVALGGLAALLVETRGQLVARGRDAAPLQRARLGHVMIAHHGAWLWLKHASIIASTAERDATEAVAYINLARTAVEAGCMGAMQLVQRSLGLSAFIRSNAVERLSRDLATYLRQPAPDEALDEAAGYFMTHSLPGEPP